MYAWEGQAIEAETAIEKIVDASARKLAFMM